MHAQALLNPLALLSLGPSHKAQARGTPAAPTRHDTTSVPASAPPPEVQEDQASASHQKGVQAGAPPIPRAFGDEILTVLSNLPEEWPLVKIDLILNKAETYYVSWRRFLYLNERLRTLDRVAAARTISSNISSNIWYKF